MAKVGTAYVEIKPDLTGFARELKDGLKKHDVDYKVDIKPDLSGFTKELKAELKDHKAPEFEVQIKPDLKEFKKKLDAELAGRKTPKVKLQVVPDFTGFLAELRTRLAAMPLPKVRLKVEVDRNAIKRAVGSVVVPGATDAGVVASKAFAGGMKSGLEGAMNQSQIGGALLSLMSSPGGIIGLAVAAAALNVAIQFVIALSGALVGLLGGLSLIALGIFGQKNDKEIKARAKKLGKTFIKELGDATKVFKLPIMSSLDIVFKALSESLKILQPAFDALAPVLPQLAAGIGGFVTEIAKGLADPATRDAMVRFIVILSQELPKLGQTIGDLFRDIGGHGKELSAVLRVAFGVISWVIDSLNGLIQATALNFKTLIIGFRSVETFLTVTLGIVKAAWSQTWEAMSQQAVKVLAWIIAQVNRFRTIFKAVWKFVTADVRGAWAGIVGAVKGAWAQINSSVNQAISSVVAKFVGLRQRILNTLSGFGSLLWSVGSDIVMGLVHGIEGAWHWVTEKVEALLGKIPPKVRELLGINSPSKVFAEIGKSIPEGLVLGIGSGGNAVANATTDLFGRIPSIGSPSFAGVGGLAGPGVPGIRVFIGDRELTDIVRVEVDGANTDTARALVSGRRL